MHVIFYGLARQAYTWGEAPESIPQAFYQVTIWGFPKIGDPNIVPYIRYPNFRKVPYALPGGAGS